jgi:hypothetical protein
MPSPTNNVSIPTTCTNNVNDGIISELTFCCRDREACPEIVDAAWVTLTDHHALT